MKIDPSRSQFWQELSRSGLIEPSVLNDCWESIPESKRNVETIDRRLARELIASGHLTLWQARMILSGRSLGLRVDRYIILDLIGQGGMGRVYLARDTRLNRRVALKILSRERMKNPRAVARFNREAKLGAQLQHENLVRIYDEGEWRELRYLVMEHIEGRNAAQLLSEVGMIPPPAAVSIARQVAMGLEHARKKGLIHRDVNPQNVLLTTEGVAKLADLGLAIDVDDSDDIVTRDGATVGTFDYISPEQARHPREIDIRSDLYSLGCTLYQLISGQVPFPSQSLPEKLYAHQIKAPDSLSDLVTNLPDGLEFIVLKLMAKAPEERYETPGELAELLRPFDEGITQVGRLVAASMNRPPAPNEFSSPGDLEMNIQSPEQNTGGEKRSSRAESKNPTQHLRPTAVGLKARRQHEDSNFDDQTTEGGDGHVLPIDLGPELPLSDRLNTTRSNKKRLAKVRSRPKDQDLGVDDQTPKRVLFSPRTKRRIGGLLILLLVLFVGIVAGWLIQTGIWRQEREQSNSMVPSDSEDLERNSSFTENGDGAFLVQVPGSDQPVPYQTLQKALSRLPSQGGVILVDSEVEPIQLHDQMGSLDAPGKNITLKPRDQSEPTVIQIELDGTEPFLRKIDGELTIQDLDFQISFGGDQARLDRAPLFDISAEFQLSRCRFEVVKSVGRETRLAVVRGQHAVIEDSIFIGFDRVIEIYVYPKHEYQIENCVFDWPPGVTDRRNGVAVRLVARPALGGLSSEFLIQDCTTRNAQSLIETRGVSELTKLVVNCSNSAIEAETLVRWLPGKDDAEPTPFPQGLKWNGQGNRYGILGTYWVVTSDDGLQTSEDLPSDLESWVDLMGQDDSTQEQVDFANPDRANPPGDPNLYQLLPSGGETLGADPSQLGPRFLREAG